MGEISLKEAKEFCIPYAGAFEMNEEKKAIVRVADIKAAEALIQELEGEIERLRAAERQSQRSIAVTNHYMRRRYGG